MDKKLLGKRINTARKDRGWTSERLSLSLIHIYSDAAAEGTLAEDAAAVSYRAALQRKQDSVVRKISSTILGREDLDVVWNLTLVANLISANVEYGKIEQIKPVSYTHLSLARASIVRSFRRSRNHPRLLLGRHR